MAHGGGPLHLRAASPLQIPTFEGVPMTKTEQKQIGDKYRLAQAATLLHSVETGEKLEHDARGKVVPRPEDLKTYGLVPRDS